MLQNIETNEIISEAAFRALFPYTYFPAVLTDQNIAGFGHILYTPPPEPEVPYVAQSISPWQARKILRRYNLLDTVIAVVATLDADAQDGWEYATEIRRDNELVLYVAGLVGMTSEQLDTMFTEGAAL